MVINAMEKSKQVSTERNAGEHGKVLFVFIYLPIYLFILERDKEQERGAEGDRIFTEHGA